MLGLENLAEIAHPSVTKGERYQMMLKKLYVPIFILFLFLPSGTILAVGQSDRHSSSNVKSSPANEIGRANTSIGGTLPVVDDVEEQNIAVGGCRRECVASHTEEACVNRQVCRIVCTAAGAGTGAAVGGGVGAAAGIGAATQVCQEVCDTVPECSTVTICDEWKLGPCW